jgi:phage gp46-like protein
MADFKLLSQGYYYDFSINDFGHVESGPDVESAVYISIFTDRRSEEGDEVLDGNFRGWWGDTYNDAKIGSRLWTLKRRKATLSVLREANDIIKQCLQWLVDDGVASEIKVQNEWSRINIGRMNMLIEIFKPDGTQEDFKFEEQWGVDR